MTKMHVVYKRDFHTETTHESGAKITTSPPADIGGMAKTFSPTDLLGVSLATCMMTVLAMSAKKNGFDCEGMSADVEKIMVMDPHRRIGKIIVRIRCPHTPTAPIREKLEAAAIDCPVHLSLHPNVKQEIEFIWGL